MGQEESRTVGYLFSALVGFVAYSIYVIQQYQEGAFATTTIDSSWGVAVLVVIGVQIVLSIITAIVVAIIEAIRAGGEEVPEITDERDKLIELKANQISFVVFGIGFGIAMITLAVGITPLVMFNLIVLALFGAGILGYISQLYRYRRGF